MYTPPSITRTKEDREIPRNVSSRLIRNGFTLDLVFLFNQYTGYVHIHNIGVNIEIYSAVTPNKSI